MKRSRRIYVKNTPDGQILSNHPLAGSKGKKQQVPHIPLPVSPPPMKIPALKTPNTSVFVIQASRSQHAQRIDKALVAQPPATEADWKKHPNRLDIEGLDSKGPLPPLGAIVRVVGEHTKMDYDVKMPKKKPKVSSAQVIQNIEKMTGTDIPETAQEVKKAKITTFYVHTNIKGQEWKEVKGTQLFGMTKNDTDILFLHRKVSSYTKTGYSKGWVVSEAKTGLSIGTGAMTKQAAIDKAKAWIKENEDKGYVVHDIVRKAIADPEKLSPLFKTEQPFISEQAETIQAVKTGEIKTPKQMKVPVKTQDIIEQQAKTGEKDWDKDLVQVSGKKGTNEGGLYKDKKTQLFYYIKWPQKSNQANNEYLASRLYQLAGVPVPEMRLIKFGGKTAVMSEWLDDAAPMTANAMHGSKLVRQGFIADAWLANWDVVGTNFDNIVYWGDKPYRIDLGGTMLYRAQGGTKEFSGPKIKEIETMTSPAYATQASKVFGDLTLAEKKAGAKKVLAISDSQIDEAVDSADIMDAEHLKSALKSRRDWLNANILNYKPPKPLTVAQLRKASKLPPDIVKYLAEQAEHLTPKGHPPTTNRKAIQHKVMVNQLGEQKGQFAAETIDSQWSKWKGSPEGTKAQMLRWGAGAHFGRGKATEDRIISYYKESKGHAAKDFIDDFKKAKVQYGEATKAGVGINRGIHTVVLREQFKKNEKGKVVPGKTVTLYRAWRPNLVQMFGWGGANEGDEIIVDNPTMFGHSFGTGTPNGFLSHGGIMTKVTVPIENICITDRVLGSSYMSEDEVLFLVPKGYRMEVVKKK